MGREPLGLGFNGEKRYSPSRALLRSSCVQKMLFSPGDEDCTWEDPLCIWVPLPTPRACKPPGFSQAARPKGKELM